MKAEGMSQRDAAERGDREKTQSMRRTGPSSLALKMEEESSQEAWERLPAESQRRSRDLIPTNTGRSICQLHELPWKIILLQNHQKGRQALPTIWLRPCKMGTKILGKASQFHWLQSCEILNWCCLTHWLCGNLLKQQKRSNTVAELCLLQFCWFRAF